MTIETLVLRAAETLAPALGVSPEVAAIGLVLGGGSALLAVVLRKLA